MAAPIEILKNFMENAEDSTAKALCPELEAGHLTVTSLIENLGEHLTSTDTSVRARATRLVGVVLHGLPRTFLSSQQVSLLSTFLCEKLHDHHSIQPQAIYGLEALSQATSISGEVIETICRTIFKEVHVQSLAQATRRSVFNIIHHFLTQHLQDVQKMGTDFVYGYLQAMDSEQDPRNLILAFTCAQLVIQNFPLGVFVEELFEVVSVYFPIDFTPSATDPSGISREDLIMGLRRCLAATPKFAQHCLPLLMEKLTSDLKSAKIDALQTLAVCAEVYGAENMYEYQSSFFNCIKKEVFLSGDTAVEESALAALQAIVRTLSNGVTLSDRKKSLDGFVAEILTECKNHLLEPELMLMLSTGRLLQAAALGSESACSQIVNVAVPLLVEAHSKHLQATPRHNVIVVLNGLMDCTVSFNFGVKNPVLFHHKDPVMLIYDQAVDDDTTSVQMLGVQGVHRLVTLHSGCLLDQERSYIAEKLVNKAVQESCEDEVRKECEKTLQYLLGNHHDNVKDNIFPVLFAKLQNDCMQVEGQSSCSRTCVLEVLSEITLGADSVQCVTEVLYNMLLNRENLEQYEAISKCLSTISARCSSDDASLKVLTLGASQIHQLVSDKCRCPKWFSYLSQESVLKHLAAFLRSMAVHWNQESSRAVQTLFVSTYLQGSPTQRCTCCEDDEVGSLKCEQMFAPFKVALDAVFIALLTPVVCSGPAKFQKDIPHIEELEKELSGLVFQPLESQANVYACKCLAGLINKQEQSESLDEWITSLYNRLSSAVDTSQSECQGHHVWLLSWVTKALTLRGHKSAQQFTNLLISLLSSKELGHESAKGFSIIMTDYEDILNKQMHANIRMMYRQRFFLENLQSIIDGHSKAKSDLKSNYIAAVLYLIQNLNRSVLLPEISKIYPLLIQSFSCDDLDLKLVAMETLSDLISSSPDVIQQQIDSLIPQLVRMSSYKPSMKVRMSALKCLSAVTTLPQTVVLPYQKTVVRALLPVLDDRKRLVRAEAVQARQNWILLDMNKK